MASRKGSPRVGRVGHEQAQRATGEEGLQIHHRRRGVGEKWAARMTARIKPERRRRVRTRDPEDCRARRPVGARGNAKQVAGSRTSQWLRVTPCGAASWMMMVRRDPRRPEREPPRALKPVGCALARACERVRSIVQSAALRMCRHQGRLRVTVISTCAPADAAPPAGRAGRRWRLDLQQLPVGAHECKYGGGAQMTSPPRRPPTATRSTATRAAMCSRQRCLGPLTGLLNQQHRRTSTPVLAGRPATI